MSSNEDKFFNRVYNGDIYGARKLVKIPGFNYNYTNKYGITILMYASLYNIVDIVRILVKMPDINIDKENQCNDAISYAWSSGSYETVEILLTETKYESIIYKDIDIDIGFKIHNYNYMFNTEEFKQFKQKIYYRGIMSVGLPLPNDVMRHIIMNYI